MPGAGAASAEEAAGAGSDCSDCSHCAKRAHHPARAGVRVSVGLHHFFSDQRARAFMWAPYGRCVQWLGRRVARVFGLPDDIALMSRGHMLPVNEPLLMLDRDDPIEVVNMSYVFTAQEKEDKSNPSSQNNRNDTNQTNSSVVGREASNVSFNTNIKQESAGQLPTSSQGEILADNQDLSAFCVGEVTEQAGDDGEELRRLKRRALRLLDEHCNMIHEATAPKRVRRRRRRKPQPLEPLPPDTDGSPAGDATPVLAGATVLRNGSGSRPPRLVRPLSPVAL